MRIPLATREAFVDELRKIAAEPKYDDQAAQSPAETTQYTNSSLAPSSGASGLSTWDQKELPDIRGAKKHKAVQVMLDGLQSLPARKANELFGRKATVTKQGLTRNDDSSEAKSQDRSQSPIDAQSTANLSQGGAMYPASGPGGV